MIDLNFSMPRQPRNERGAKFIKRATVGMISVILIYGICWAGSAAFLYYQAENWIQNQQGSEVRLTHGKPVIGGSWWSVSVTYPQAKLAVRTLAGPIEWDSQSIRVMAPLLQTNRLLVGLSGEHVLRLPGHSSNRLAVSLQSAAMTLFMEGSRNISSARFEASGVSASSDPEHLSPVTLDKGFVVIRLEDTRLGEPGVVQLEFDAHGLRLPAAPPEPLIATIQSLHIVAETTLTASGGPSVASALEHWRQEGGTLEIEELGINWPPFSVFLSGTAALDKHLQPIGAFSARFQGFFELLDTLVSNGTVKSSDASMARIVLGLMARAPQGGGAPELSVSVTIQDRELYAGPVKLMDIPPINWAEPLEN